jgi:hypothetical protein
MKNTTYILSLSMLFIAGSLFTGCLSSEQKKKAADAKLVVAQDNLNKVQINANVAAENAATAEELKTFRLESDLKIKTNEAKIAELKLKMNKTKVKPDPVFAREIDSLEIKNTNLKKRMADYEKTNSSWTKFKRDFNRDLDELGNTLKRLANQNNRK